MKLIKDIALISLLGLIITNYSNASDMYIGVGGGFGNNSGVGKLYAGAGISQYFALEGDYEVWGSSQYTTNLYNGVTNSSYQYTVNPQSLDLLLVGKLQLGASPISIHAKLGGAYVFVNSSNISSQGASYGTNSGGFTAVGGLGAGLDVGKSIRIDIDWINYGFIQPVGITSSIGDVGTFSTNNYELGISYNF